MPTFITKEQFSCGHGLETYHLRCSFGNEKHIITEMIPVPIRCLSCICQELLDSSRSGMPRLTRACVAELQRHIRALSHNGMAVPVEMVKDQVLKPGNVEEFRVGIMGLAGIAEIKARFIAE